MKLVVRQNVYSKILKRSTTRVDSLFGRKSCVSNKREKYDYVKRNYRPGKFRFYKRAKPINEVIIGLQKGRPHYKVQFSVGHIDEDCVVLRIEWRNQSLNGYQWCLEFLKDDSGNPFPLLHEEKKAAEFKIPLNSYETICQNLKSAAEEMTKTDEMMIKFLMIPEYIYQAMIAPDDEGIEIDWKRLPEPLFNALLPFQKEGIAFGIQKNGRCMLFDDMGLGKTVQALGMASYFRKDWPLLIICPSALRENWRKEILQWGVTTEDEIHMIQKKEDLIWAEENGKKKGSNIFILSFDQLARSEYNIIIDKIKFKFVIVDESHYIKQSSSQRTKASTKAIRNAKRAVLISGTASPSRPIELYEQLKALFQKKRYANEKFMNKTEFGERYCDPKANTYQTDFRGANNLAELNTFLNKTAMIRRLKHITLKDDILPKIREIIELPPVEIDKEFKELSSIFDQQKKSTKTKKEVDLSIIDTLDPTDPAHHKILDLYRETAKIKSKTCLPFVKKIVDEQQRTLIFAHHQIVLNSVEEILKEEKVKYIRIDGNTQSKDRFSMVESFQNLECNIALLSITAIGVGLNFLPCENAVFCELTWVPSQLFQAEDRIHRIGQDKQVHIKYLMQPGTLDEYIWPMLEKKFEIVQDTLNHHLDSKKGVFEL